MTNYFQVKDNQNQRVIDFTPISDDIWKVVTKTNNSTSMLTMSNEQVEQSYNYFTSHWIDYDINF